jgi:hypothetical protein
MKKMKKRKFVSFVFFLFLILPNLNGAQNQKVIVTVDETNVYLKPDPNSAVVLPVIQNTVLEVTERVGQWYFVTLPPDDSGYDRAGYIQMSKVSRPFTPDSGEKKPETPSESERKVTELRSISPVKLRIIKEFAEVRAEPDAESTILMTFSQDFVLLSKKKAEEWYVIRMTAQGKKPYDAFIHQDDVEILKE